MGAVRGRVSPFSDIGARQVVPYTAHRVDPAFAPPSSLLVLRNPWERRCPADS
jgi:hypothetical protein